MTRVAPQVRATHDPRTIAIGFNCWVDYCVWVLERDGLQVAPFTAHPQHLGILRSDGLTPEHWRTWFERIVQHQHPILEWNGQQQSQDEWVEQRLEEAQRLNRAYVDRVHEPAPDIDWSAHRARLVSDYDFHSQLRSSVIAELGDSALDREFTAQHLIALCPGTPTLKTHLTAFWEEYEAEIEPERYATLPMQNAHGQIKGQLSSALGRLSALNIHLIAYSSTIDILIPSSAIVTSKRIDAKTHELDEYVRLIVPQLEALTDRA